MTVLRHEEWGPGGLQRYEIERVAGTPTYREFGADRVVRLTRTATVDEAERLASMEAEEAAAARRTRYANAATVLDAWAADADAAVASWDGWTTAQRFAATKVMMARFGTLCGRLSDLIGYLEWKGQ